MNIKRGSVVRSLSWRGFFRLFTHLPSFFKLFSRLVKDPRINLGPKLVVLAILGYVVLPADFLPDFIPGLGQADDLAVIITGLKLFLRLCPPEVVQEHVKAISAGH